MDKNSKLSKWDRAAVSSYLRSDYGVSAVADTAPFSGSKIGVIGTSLVQLNDYSATGASPQIAHWSRGWLTWAKFYAGRLFSCPVWFDAVDYTGRVGRGFQGLNDGVGSDTLDMILARKTYLATKIDCDIVIIDAGTNDVPSMTADQIHAKRVELVNYFLSFGKRVILFPILARSISSWAGGSSYRAIAHKVNILTRDFCRTKKNLYFFDWNASWVDFTSTYGEPKSGYAIDGLHFGPKGGEAMGYALAQFLATILPAAQNVTAYPDDVYDATNNPFGNRFSNPLCTGTSGTTSTGASGNVATGFNVQRSSGTSTVVCSKETRSDGLGDYQVLTFTPSGSGSDLFYFKTATTDIAYSDLVSGDWVQARIKLETNNWGGFKYISPYIRDLTSGGGAMVSFGMKEYTGYLWDAKARAGYIITPPLMVEANAPTLRWRVDISLDATVAGTPIIKIGEVELRKVQDPRTLLNWSAPQ